MPTGAGDGKGQASPKSKTPVEATDVGVHGSTPGGESKKGSQISIEGPNAPKHKK